MSCFDCKKAVPKLCQGNCCYTVPFENNLYHQFESFIITRPIRIEKIDDANLIPITKSGRCCFLKEDYTCNIYKYRPKICRIFGTFEGLPCEFIHPSGKLRTSNERKIIHDKIVKDVDDFVNKTMLEKLEIK